MKFVKTVVTNIVASAALTAGSVVGLGVGATLFNEKIEPWMKEKLHKEMKKSGKMFFKSILSKSQNSSDNKIPDHVDDLDALFATGCFDSALDQFKKR